MRVAQLNTLARERGLRGYSRMRKGEIIELIRNNQHGLASWAPDIPPHRVGSVTPPRNKTTRLGGAQVPWVWRTQVASDPRPARNGGPKALRPLLDQRGPTKLSRLGLDLIIQDSLHGAGLLNKKWIYLNNKK